MSFRNKQEHYSDKDAAKTKLNTSKKPKLHSTPFVRELDYGANCDGYWSYKSMVLQMEDCIDCLKFLFPEFDFLFLVDHSNSHNHLQPDGLNINKINIYHGGKQPIMHDSKISAEMLGPFHTPESTLQPGMLQCMQYDDTDIGPCYLSERERMIYHFDINKGQKRTRDLNKAELVTLLESTGHSDAKGTKTRLQQKCETLGINTKVTEDVVTEGWKLKPKGSFQILFKRGWINPACISMYTADGRKDVSTGTTDGQNNAGSNNGVSNGSATVEGEVDPTNCNFSIKKLMQLQTDFINEITLLEFHANKLGVLLDRSPKCHPEVAGEGIEYLWALSKLNYRRSSMELKRTKDLLRKLVCTSTDPATVLNKKRVRSCSKKACSYMKLYQAIESLDFGIDKENPTVDSHSILEDSVKLYLKLKKKARVTGVL